MHEHSHHEHLPDEHPHHEHAHRWWWPFGHDHDHGPPDPDIVENRQGVRVLAISFAVLAVTAVAQAVVVYFTGSVALLADTVHNVGDALTSVPLAIAFLLSTRPPSRRFGYGLARTEDLAGLVIVALIGFSGLVALVESVRRLIEPSTPDHLIAGIAAGVLGFLGNEAVAIYRIRQGRRMQSAALIADGEHARTDGLTSLSVAAGLGMVAAGFELADPLIGLLISMVIFRIAWNTARDVGFRLLDGVETQHSDQLRRAAVDVFGERAMRSVRARWHGHVIHADVIVDPAFVAWERSQDLADELVARLRADHSRVRRVSLVAAESLPPSALQTQD